MRFFVEQLASICSSTYFENLSPEMIHQTKRNLLDTLGCGLGAYRLRVNQDLVDFVQKTGGRGEATIWGYGHQVPLEHASLLNGMLTTHLEFDSNPEMVSAAFPVAEYLSKSGQDLLTAIAAGFVAKSVFKDLFATEVERHGFHWPAQLSTAYVAASTSKLWDGSADHMARSISFAASLSPVAPYEAFVKGARVKVFYGAWPCYIATLATRLCSAGFSGPLSILEGELSIGRGWHHRMLEKAAFEKALEIAQSPSAVYQGYKYFPTNTCALGPLTAIKNLLEKQPDLDIQQIERVEIGTYSYSYRLSSQSSADSAISAKANIPFLCAAMLRDHQVLPEHTEPPMLYDTQLQELANRIEVYELPGTDTDHRNRHRPAKVKILFRRGVVIEESVEDPIWRVDSAPDDALEEKFYRLVGDIMPDEKKHQLVHAIWNLENVTDISEIIAYLRMDST
jgi:2-methylcitrate dehydratase